MSNRQKLISKEDSIFLAGHRGMAGKSIFKALNDNGYKNILIMNRKELDLTNEKDVSDWFEKNKPRVVILAAAKVGGIEANNNNPTEFLLENIKIQNNVIENSWKNNVKRLLFLGSSCIYPKLASQPIYEEELLSSYLEPTNESYALAKILGIRLCTSLRKQYGFDAISLMPTNLYGPGDNYHPQNSHVLPSLIRKFHNAKINEMASVECWGDGSAFREFMHVDDLGNASLFALENWDPNHSNSPKYANGESLTFLNVGTGKDITIKNLSDRISSILDFKGDIVWDTSKPNGTPRKLLNSDRLKSLGWVPKISLEEGLKETINSYQELYKKNNLRGISN
mgnify:CR=1 FL=1